MRRVGIMKLIDYCGVKSTDVCVHSFLLIALAGCAGAGAVLPPVSPPVPPPVPSDAVGLVLLPLA